MFTVKRAGCAGARGCASGPIASWSATTSAGARSFSFTRKLSPGRYTLTLTTSGGSRSAPFRVR